MFERVLNTFLSIYLNYLTSKFSIKSDNISFRDHFAQIFTLTHFMPRSLSIPTENI